VTPARSSRVAFFAQLRFHDPILRPVFEKVAAGAPSLLSGDRAEVVRFRPDILVLASTDLLEFFRHHLPSACIGSVRHGLIGKRGIVRQPNRPSARRLDFLFVGDPLSIADYRAKGAAPAAVFLTGYPQVDPLFGRDPGDRLGLDPSLPVVVYAPTWNLGLSSAVMLGENLAEAIRGSGPRLGIIIKPHPVIGDWRRGWMRGWRRLTLRDRQVRLIEDTHVDVTRYLLASDLLVSDASSVVLEYLALDRPIVLVTNPRASADPAFERDDPIWRSRDIAEEVGSAADLAAAVARALARPDLRFGARARLADLMFGNLRDGCNTDRVARQLLELCAMRPEERPRIPSAEAAPPEPGWRAHDMRVRIRASTLARRTVLGLLESVRFRLRARHVASLVMANGRG
jgi:hypothetical protein